MSFSLGKKRKWLLGCKKHRMKEEKQNKNKEAHGIKITIRPLAMMKRKFPDYKDGN